MKYSRVLVFSVGLYLLLVALSTIATKIVGFDEMIQSTSYIYTQYVLGFVASLIVYLYLGYRQTVSPYIYPFLVAAVYWFINLSVGALLSILLEITMEPLIYLIPVLLHVIAVLLGTLLGIQLRSKKFSVIKIVNQNLSCWFCYLTLTLTNNLAAYLFGISKKGI